ncbi:hypothetical protein ATANTOWER_010652, partial [Ataeniobius toweri]|nr:hypothetical protein [Ataeniobius toweri]
ATTACQGLGTPPTPHLNPGGVPACWAPTLPHDTPCCTKQAGQPGPPLKQSHIPINAAHCLAKTPHRSPLPLQPTEWAPKPGNEAQRKPKRSHESQNASPGTINPQDPNPNLSQDPDQKAHTLQCV